MSKCKDCENFDKGWCEVWEEEMKGSARSCGEFDPAGFQERMDAAAIKIKDSGE